MNRRALAPIALLALLAPQVALAGPTDLLDKLPGSAVAAFHVDFAALRSSPHFDASVRLFQELGESGPVHPDPKSGLDPRTEIDQVAGAVLPDGSRLYVVRGDAIDEAKVRGYFRDTLGPAFTEKALGERERFTAHDGNTVVFLDAHTALVGRPKAVDKAAGLPPAKSIATAKAWKKRLARAHTSAPFWSVGTVPKGKGVPASADIESFEAHGTLGDGATVQMSLTCRSGEGCARIEERIRGGMDAARERRALRLLGVGAFLDRVQIAREDRSLRVDLGLESAQVATLLALGGKLYRAAR
jgi:hypothetical protein